MDSLHFTFTADSSALARYLESLEVKVKAGLHRVAVKDQMLVIDGKSPGVNIHSKHTSHTADVKGETLMHMAKVFATVRPQPVTIELDGLATIQQLTV